MTDPCINSIIKFCQKALVFTSIVALYTLLISCGNESANNQSLSANENSQLEKSIEVSPIVGVSTDYTSYNNYVLEADVVYNDQFDELSISIQSRGESILPGDEWVLESNGRFFNFIKDINTYGEGEKITYIATIPDQVSIYPINVYLKRSDGQGLSAFILNQPFPNFPATASLDESNQSIHFNYDLGEFADDDFFYHYMFFSMCTKGNLYVGNTPAASLLVDSSKPYFVVSTEKIISEEQRRDWNTYDDCVIDLPVTYSLSYTSTIDYSSYYEMKWEPNIQKEETVIRWSNRKYLSINMKE